MKERMLKDLEQCGFLLDRAKKLIAPDSIWHKGKDKEPWTRHELLLHLYYTEKLTLDYISLKLKENSSFKKIPWYSILKEKLLMRFLKSKRKSKSPKFVDPREIDITYNTRELYIEYEIVRENWKDLIYQTNDDIWKKGVLKHPYVGHLHGGAMMEFIKLHFERHLRQMEEKR